MSSNEVEAFLEAINREAWGIEECPETLRVPPSAPAGERPVIVEVVS